jgi:hypothetical protein
MLSRLYNSVCKTSMKVITFFMEEIEDATSIKRKSRHISNTPQGNVGGECGAVLNLD